MPFNPSGAERQAAHRRGWSTAVNRRGANAALNSAYAPGDASFLRSRLAPQGALIMTANVTYWLYVGRVARATLFNKIAVGVNAAGVGTGVQAVAIGTTPSAPNGTAQNVTCVALSLAFTTVGVGADTVVTNSDNLGYTAQATEYLWIGYYTNLTTTQPTVYGVTRDMGGGEILVTLLAGPAVGNTYTTQTQSPFPAILACPDMVLRGT